MEYRPLGNTGLRISTVALGSWPIAGLTSPGTTDADSLATIRSCLDLGINHIDTAYMYGRHGESERLIARALGSRRNEIVLATKVGQHWDASGRQICDASSAMVRHQCEESLRRLQTDEVELLYLHMPDPNTPIQESALALRRLMEEGKTRSVGVSNVTLEQMKAFAAVCPIVACQPVYNMLQRDIEADVIPWCQEHGVSVIVYWAILKGLLAGRLARDARFENDSRRKYPMFQGEEYQKNLDLVDRLRAIAALSDHTVAQLVINWTIHRPGITAALCGAKRPEQLRETAPSSGWHLSSEQLARIDAALAQRDSATSRQPV